MNSGNYFINEGKGKMNIKRSGFPVSIILITIVTSLLFSCSSGANGKQAMQPGAAPVTASVAVMKNVPIQLNAIGNVEAYSTVSVKTRVDGQLIGVYFREGQDVKKNDLLFRIDPRPIQALLDQADANLAKDQAQARNAAEQARRYSVLVQKDYVAKEQYDQILANSEALSASVKADQALVDNYKLQLQYCTVRSPIDGRVGSLLVNEGNMVKTNDTVLVTIKQMTPIYVSFSVPEQELPGIKKYMSRGKLKVNAIIPGEEQRPVRGTLAFINNAVDSSTGTILLKGTFANSAKRLWPGQFVSVVLTLKNEPDSIVIPNHAVQTGQAGSYVYLIKPDLTAVSVPVKVIRTAGDESVIEGVKAGDRVVTDGQLRVIPGAKVDIKNEPAKVLPAKAQSPQK